MTVERTIYPERISGKDIITSICEINGCFGHIGRDGKFHYIYLPQAIEGLYPSNTLFPDHAPEHMAQAKSGHLYPQDPKSARIGSGTYRDCQYEDFIAKPITKLQIRKEENDIGKIWPETPNGDKDNCYIIQDNFLVYEKSSDKLSVIAQNLLGKITDITYRPFSAECVGNPCFEVGDPIRFPTKYTSKVEIKDKINLTIEEAAEYSNIGICKIKELARVPNCPFVLYIGRKKLIKRKEFEKYLSTVIEL